MNFAELFSEADLNRSSFCPPHKMLIVSILASLVMCCFASTKGFVEMNLTEFPVPGDIPSDTTVLNLDKNDITYIPEGSLCHITNLEKLSMYDNKLTSLGNLTCVGQTLIKLDVTKNTFQGLPASAFEGLDVLEELLLNSNKLTEFPDIWSLGDTLKTLSLSYNPNMGGLPDTPTFNQLSALINLYIDQIGLTSFPDLSAYYNQLEKLYIGEDDLAATQAVIDEINKFTLLYYLHIKKSAADFPQLLLPKLRYLYLQANDLSSATKAIPDLPELISLKITHSSLSEFPAVCAFGDTLVELILYHNSISQIRAVHAACLRKLNRLIVNDNPLQRLEDFLNIANNPSAKVNIEVKCILN